MENNNWEEIYRTALQWTKEAGEYIRKEMYNSFAISTKANADDLVTDVDKAVEDFFQKKIHTHFPSHRLMGEEGSYQYIKDLSGVVWILDPIDGTINFVHQRSFFAISVGIYYEGKGFVGIVYDVMNDEIFTALKGQGAYVNGKSLSMLPQDTVFHETILSVNAGWIFEDRRLEKLVREARGTRSYGAAALEIAYVAANRLDAYISFQLAPWDVAGGNVILQEVGGKSSNYQGNELTLLKSDSYLAASPEIHQQILRKVHDDD